MQAPIRTTTQCHILLLQTYNTRENSIITFTEKKDIYGAPLVSKGALSSGPASMICHITYFLSAISSYSKTRDQERARRSRNFKTNNE